MLTYSGSSQELKVGEIRLSRIRFQADNPHLLPETRMQIARSKDRLNMELDLQSLFGLHVHSCSYWLRPRNATTPLPPYPAFGLIYEGAIGQPR
jgi:hypothetical protein